jgi:hypothetical protein
LARVVGTWRERTALDQLPAHLEAVHAIGVAAVDGQGVLVTELVEGAAPPGADPHTFRTLGELLGRLHALRAAGGALERDAGCLHIWSVSDGGLRDALDAAASWLAEVELMPEGERDHCESLLDTIAGIDVGARGGPAERLEAALAERRRGSRRLRRPGPAHVRGAGPAPGLAPPVHDCMRFCMGRMALEEVTGGFAAISRIAEVLAARARQVLA